MAHFKVRGDYVEENNTMFFQIHVFLFLQTESWNFIDTVRGRLSEQLYHILDFFRYTGLFLKHTFHFINSTSLMT
jgi:hypothetical protein